MIKKLLPVLTLFIPVTVLSQTFSVNTNTPIPDNPGPAAVVQINVSGLPSVINSSFGLAEVCLDITHTWDSDLEMRLVSPDGSNYILIGGIGGDGDNFTGTCLANNGSNGFIVNAAAPFSGQYVPMHSLADYNNSQDPNGTWELQVNDTYAADTGSILFVSLSFTANPPGNPGPPPVICTTCVCPGGAPSCDMLPDMTASALIIQQQHFEAPGIFNISNATPNIGWGPLEVHGTGDCYCDTLPVSCTTSLCPNGQPPKEQVIQTIYVRTNNNDTLTGYNLPAGFMSYHPTHGHTHVDDWANYTIRQATANPDATTWPILGTGTKQSFCLINLGDCTSSYGYCVDTSGAIVTMADVLNAGFGIVSGCGRDQGIYPGMLDIYDMFLNDPIDLTGICNGDYYLVSITDPNNNFLEANENNNWVAVPITLTQQMAPPSASFSTIQNGTQVSLTANNLSNATSFEWDFGDGFTDNSNNPTVHTYTANGIYTITFTVNSPCGIYVDSILISITSVGIVENNIPDNYFLTALPNPANGNTTISYFVAESSEHISIDLINAVGQKVSTLLNSNVSFGKHNLELDFDAMKLPSGIYFAKLNTKSRNIAIRLVNLE